MPYKSSYPGVYIEEIPGGVHTINGVSTGVAAFIGYTAKGPANKAVQISGWRDYESTFGGINKDSPVSYAVQQFFLNGGINACVVRVIGKPHRKTPSGAEVTGKYEAKTGMYALRDVDIFNILAIPQTTVLNDAEARKVIANAIEFCEAKRAFYLVDYEPTRDFTTIVAWVSGLGSQKNAAVFFPRVLVADPTESSGQKEIPVSGTIAGLFIRTDQKRGIWKAPAGKEADLRGITGPSLNLSKSESTALNRLGINCLSVLPRVGTVCWGARTMAGADKLASEWKYIPIRRLALFIEESISRGTQWVVFEPNGEPLWAKIRLNAGAFMHDLWAKEAFQGTTERDAYFVKCDKGTTTQNDIDTGIVNILVGFAPVKPVEFVIIKIQQITGNIAPYKEAKTASWDDLVLPEAPRHKLAEIAAAVRQLLEVKKTRGRGSRISTGQGITALFTGAGGTGKTKAAGVLANELHLDLYRIDLSQVVSKYIGETEKNLSRLFDAAERGGAILFFDEADALFGKRGEVKDSHDRYANIETNYLLQRMEDYRGLAILATNNKEDLDPAFLRRLRFVVNFSRPGVYR